MKKILIILFLCVMSFNLYAEDVNKNIKIYVSSMKPCVIVEDKEYAGGDVVSEISGFEIDLWRYIAQELKIKGIIKEYEIVSTQWSGIEENIKNGNADVAFSGFTIRSQRMEWADFSIPTMNSGLGIMILKEEVGMFQGFIILCQALKGPVIFFALFILIFAFILWLSENDKDESNDENGISDKFIPGIFEAIYFCIVTCSTVGYGDFAPKKWRTRFITGVLIIVGLGAFGNFLSLLSVARIENITGGIQSVEDLKGKVVLTQAGTTSVKFVEKLGVSKVKTVDSIERACDNLLLERGDAVVYDYPILLNYVKENSDKVSLVPGMFDEQYYGFVFPRGSKLKRYVDRAILELYEEGTYQDLYKKWF